MRATCLVVTTILLACLVVFGREPSKDKLDPGGDHSPPPTWPANSAWSSQWGGTPAGAAHLAPSPLIFSLTLGAHLVHFTHQTKMLPMNGPPGMYYPQNWHSGYAYPPQHPVYANPPPLPDNGGITTRDDRMVVDEEHMRLPVPPSSSIPSEDQSSSRTDRQPPPGRLERQALKRDKGKGKATAEEVRNGKEENNRSRTESIQRGVEEETIPPDILALARRIHEQDRVGDLKDRLHHEQDRVGDLEDCLRRAHESLARTLKQNRQLERDLESAKRSSKRARTANSEDVNERQPSKRAKPPSAGPSRHMERPRVISAARIDDENTLDEYLSDSSKRKLRENEKKFSHARPVKPRRKDQPKEKLLTVLPRLLEFLKLRIRTTYSRDSRVHNSTITEGTSTEDWISFLTGNMGPKPIHPDELPPKPTHSSGDPDDSDDDDSDEEGPEPWHIKWDRQNPLSEDAPKYKIERQNFLKIEQKKFDQHLANRAINKYNNALARWEGQSGRLPDALPSTEATGQTECHNGFWRMIGPGFLYIPKYNMVLVNAEALSATRVLDSGQAYRPPGGNNQHPNPRGFPMNVRELKEMVSEVQGRHPRWRSDLYLLAEFYRISSSVRLEYRDYTMQTAITWFDNDWMNIRAQFDTLDPPDFIPMPIGCAMSNLRTNNHGAGLVCPVNRTIDKWCRYIAHHMHPGGCSTPSGTGMDTSYQVSIPHTWGYLLSAFLSPENDHRGVRSSYARLFAGIVARPHWYSLRIEEINSTPNEPNIVIAPSSNVLEHMEWDAHGRDMTEDDVIRHLAGNGVTQEMVDSAYPYGVTFIDCGISTESVHADFYSDIDSQRHVLLEAYSVPPTIDAHRGWWYPDSSDLERIRLPERRSAIGDVKKSECIESAGTSNSRTVFDWFHVGEHYIYEWLSERPPPVNDEALGTHVPRSPSPQSPPKSSQDEDVDMTQQAEQPAPVGGPNMTPVTEIHHQEGPVAVATAHMDGSRDTTIIDIGMGTVVDPVNHTIQIVPVNNTPKPNEEMPPAE
ncbi:hypothetical protein ARMGADRAFT_1030434 [Armillaria gallica]|uniref:Uncharacterized protein n=1 Tax=Armillaria gallica TaxID=47427 RepID=A0A2H3DGM5_ARMGA|nr:hypothetical protein ARMGADRAFT_1030434 [Armillaria gallica]